MRWSPVQATEEEKEHLSTEVRLARRPPEPETLHYMDRLFA